jgi:serine/threonine protein kinase
MRQIANALQTMHATDVVRRELSPRFVIVRSVDRSAVLTDFELAKLLDGAPTVSPKDGWPDDEYRAIETDSHANVDARADIYSWGRILIRATCGTLPAKGQEADALANAKLPPAVKRVALSCVAMPRSDRPDSMTKVIAAIKSWT